MVYQRGVDMSVAQQVLKSSVKVEEKKDITVEEIIGGYCLVLRQVGVGQELVCTAFTLHQFFGSEFPGYPVGYL